MEIKTKVIDLTQEQSKLKPITFERMVRFYSITMVEVTYLPSVFDNVELICRNYQGSCDIMFAYDNGHRNDGILFFGKFNDGVVA